MNKRKDSLTFVLCVLIKSEAILHIHNRDNYEVKQIIIKLIISCKFLHFQP